MRKEIQAINWHHNVMEQFYNEISDIDFKVLKLVERRLTLEGLIKECKKELRKSAKSLLITSK